MLTFLAWPHRILRAIKIRIEALRKQERIYRLFSLIVECVLAWRLFICGKERCFQRGRHHSGLKKDSGFLSKGWSTYE